MGHFAVLQDWPAVPGAIHGTACYLERVASKRLKVRWRSGTRDPSRRSTRTIKEAMKKTFITFCAAMAAVALVGCDQNQGGTGRDTTTDTGTSRRDSSYPSRSMSSGSLTNTNSAMGAPSTGSSSRSGAITNSSSGANSSSTQPSESGTGNQPQQQPQQQP